jgi:hypothetical protein
LALISPAAVEDLNAIEISTRTPPIFEPMTIEEFPELF